MSLLKDKQSNSNYKTHVKNAFENESETIKTRFKHANKIKLTKHHGKKNDKVLYFFREKNV